MYVAQKDFIQNGKGHGEIGQGLQDVNFDPSLLRPYFDERGRSCVLRNTGQTVTSKKGETLICNEDGSPMYFPKYEKHEVQDLVNNHGMSQLVGNATVLTKQQWVTLSSIIRLAFRGRLRAWADLMAKSSFGGFDGMATMAMEYQTMRYPGEAIVYFDGMTEGLNDQP